MPSNSFFRENIPAIEAMGFNKFDLAYWKNPDQFVKLTGSHPNLKDIFNQLETRKEYKLRTEIAGILMKQYEQFDSQSTVFNQINLLKQPNTFTVICAHQPCLFGGPAFWAYKILSTIKLCKDLHNKYPDYNFIPVYISGNEDHDFEEINHLNIFNTRLEWIENPGQATGSLPVEGLYPVFELLKTMFARNDGAIQFLNSLKIQLDACTSYANFYRSFVDSLFGNRGLIYFDPNDAEAKALFAPIIKKELISGFISSESKSANTQIEEMSFPLQVNPRDINLFYHHSEGRKRIQKSEGYFELVDTDVRWTESEILSKLETNPSLFSPNVLMRPLYQEFLFPNVAFVGGGGEIAYWMQLRACFKHVSIPYPVLFRRFSAFYFDKSLLTKIAKTAFQPADFLKPYQELENEFISTHSNSVISIDEQLDCIQDQLQKINLAGKSLDVPTQISIESEIQKILKSLDQITAKRNKVIKIKYDQDLQNIQKIKFALFPNHSIQERFYSFLPMYFNFGEAFFDFIENSYSPGKFEVTMIYENS